MKRFLILDQALARKIEQHNLANAAQQRKNIAALKTRHLATLVKEAGK